MKSVVLIFGILASTTAQAGSTIEVNCGTENQSGLAQANVNLKYTCYTYLGSTSCTYSPISAAGNLLEDNSFDKDSEVPNFRIGQWMEGDSLTIEVFESDKIRDFIWGQQHLELQEEVFAHRTTVTKSISELKQGLNMKISTPLLINGKLEPRSTSLVCSLTVHAEDQ